MTTTTTTPTPPTTATTLSDSARQLVMDSVRHALLVVAPEWLRPEEQQRRGGLRDLEEKLPALIEIVRRTRCDRTEPYLAQILDDVCPLCGNQQHSGYCPLRHHGECVLYACAGPIMWAIGGALRRLGDPEYLATHGDPHACQAPPPHPALHKLEVQP